MDRKKLVKYRKFDNLKKWSFLTSCKSTNNWPAMGKASPVSIFKEIDEKNASPKIHHFDVED